MTDTHDDTEMDASAPSLADPIAPEHFIAEGVPAMKGEEAAELTETEVIPLPPPLLALPELASQPGSHPAHVDMVNTMAGAPEGEITITDQDVLFGRGGLTNRHIGNLRYRDIISIHRQDYVRAQKTEKPNVVC